MSRFIAKRLLLMLPLLLGISVVSFTLSALSPSDPAEVALRVNDITPTTEAIEQMREELGLNAPLHIRYLSWALGALKGDFGVSYITKTPVLHEIANALPTTLLLAGITLGLVLVWGAFLGVVCALYRNRFLDRAIRSVIFFTGAIPSFWLALLFIAFFSLTLDLFPTAGLEERSGIILPSLTLFLSYVATYMRLMRNSMLQNEHAPYIFYARARGLSEMSILKHRIINALHPFVIALGMSIPKLIAGTVVIETIFALPGVGWLCVSAIFSRDYPMIQGYVFLMALLFLLFNLLADVSIKLLDPRLRGEL